MEVTRYEEWNGLKKGDVLAVTGVKGTYTFICRTVRVQPSGKEVEWIDCYGGRGANLGLRSFDPSRCRPLGQLSFGSRARRARETRGLSREKVAARASLTVSAVARIESKGYGSEFEENGLRQALDLGYDDTTVSVTHDEEDE